jgi:hypothetical protein
MMGVALRGAAEGGFAVCFLQQGSWQVPHHVCKCLHTWPWELRINRGLKEVYMGQIEQQLLGQNQTQPSYYLKTDIYVPLLNQEKSRKTFIKTYNS